MDLGHLNRISYQSGTDVLIAEKIPNSFLEPSVTLNTSATDIVLNSIPYEIKTGGTYMKKGGVKAAIKQLYYERDYTKTPNLRLAIDANCQ